MLFAAEEGAGGAEALAKVITPSGWFLENAYLIAAIPAVAFVLIILFGKRTGKATNHGAYFGVASMVASLVLSLGAAWQWIDAVRGAEGGGKSEGAMGVLSTIGHTVMPRLAGEGGVGVAPVERSITWWQSGGLEFKAGTHIDGLAVVILVVVALISTLVQIYSLEYLRGDRRFTHFFAALTLFSGSMLAMVMADNMLLFLLGWEIMGLCSFLLIGHWWEEYANARAALKAFFTVRAGDVGLLVGIVMLYFLSNDWITQNVPGETGFSIRAIGQWALSGEAGGTALTVCAVALFIGAIGKSGQFPLHTWLPDAMAGPTPVSSLLHSSTMVVAGVFLVARLYPVFYVAFDITKTSVNLIVVIAAITIVISGLLALVQNDIKKVLAYSTVGQLGYMMLGLGVGAWAAAVFHIFTHAFFKACLFLGAGSVSHSGSHHSFDMKADMGGLARKMPITAGTFIISTLALSAVFPLSGFWSKDEIVANAGKNGYTTFMVIGLAGGFLTALYMGRCVYLTFFGQPRGAAAGDPTEHDEAHEQAHDEAGHAHVPVAAAVGVAHGGHGHAGAHGGDDAHGAHGDHGHGDAHGAHAGPHESPALITVPLVVLAVLAVFAGFLQAPTAPFNTEYFVKWFEEPMHLAGYFPALKHAPFDWAKAILSTALGLGGLAIGALVVAKDFGPLKNLTARNKAARAGYLFLWRKYYLDDLYEKVVVRAIAYPIAQAAYWINQNVLDRIVNTFGTGARDAGQFVYKYIDQGVVDGAVNGAGTAAEQGGGLFRLLQTGRVQQYGALLFGAAAVGALILVLSV